MIDITYEEFKNAGFELKEETFKKFLPQAKNQISLLTLRYYDFHDFDTDYDFRKTAYKWALMYQIVYMYKYDILTADDMVNKPISTSQSIGGSSLSKTLRSSSSDDASSVSAVSLEAISQLRMTGLLYRGIKHGYISR